MRLANIYRFVDEREESVGCGGEKDDKSQSDSDHLQAAVWSSLSDISGRLYSESTGTFPSQDHSPVSALSSL